MDTKTTLIDIINELYSLPVTMEHIIDLTNRLNRISGENWTFRYTNSVRKGSLQPSDKFRKAVNILAGLVDGHSPIQARLREITVYSTNGLRDEAIVIAHLTKKRCEYDGCGLEFWGHPNRKYCCDEHGRKARRLKLT